jgi:hypothetical protein
MVTFYYYESNCSRRDIYVIYQLLWINKKREREREKESLIEREMCTNKPFSKFCAAMVSRIP